MGGARLAAAGVTPVGAIDCGTNSTRLLIAGPDGRTLERLMRITRLGQGVDRGRRWPLAIQRTVAVLRECRPCMDRTAWTGCGWTATSAARDAANREDFFAAAADTVGVRPELLGGDEEGRLSFLGATAELGRRRPLAGRGHRRRLDGADRDRPTARRPISGALSRRGLRANH